ncbi:MAG: asparagine synthase C-terminal domain-containing protein [Patescibacteria group bacterium]
MEQYLEQMNLILSNLFKEYSSRLSTTPGILLSGGIDSSTIAYFVSSHFKEYSILSMGTNHTKDRVFIDIVSHHLNKPYTWVEITQADVFQFNIKIEQILRENNIEVNLMQRSLALGYFLIFKKASEVGITHIFTGQGPDILLGGYHKYESVTNINDEIKKDLPLLETDKKRDGAMAKHFGITLINPYLEDKFVEFALTIPQKHLVQGSDKKIILRELGKKIGLPTDIVNRPKKAFQYSTGIQDMIAKMY